MPDDLHEWEQLLLKALKEKPKQKPKKPAPSPRPIPPVSLF